MSVWETYKQLANNWSTVREKRNFLDFMNNSFNYRSETGNLEVSCLSKEGGTKWASWWDVRKNWFYIQKCNQMLIPIQFIVIDIDTNVKGNLKLAKSYLKEMNFPHLVWETGSKGFHIDVFLPSILHASRYNLKKNSKVPEVERTEQEIQNIREYLIKKLNGDLAKKTSRTLIAMPGEKHWKTGNKKRAVA